MYRLGVIPAGGKGSRWGGYLKEMLPIADGKWLIDHTINAMWRGSADAVLIVTNKEKIGPLSAHITGRHEIPVYYAVEEKGRDIWGGIEESFSYPADLYLFAMADTLYPDTAFQTTFQHDFMLGTFFTDRPDRFGIIQDGRIVNKQQRAGGPFQAWGVLAWSKRCVEYWQTWDIDTYTDAINAAIGSAGLHTWDIGQYYDMASFIDYKEWIGNGDIL